MVGEESSRTGNSVNVDQQVEAMQNSPSHGPIIQFKRVLAATDFSEGARNALRYAAAISRRYSARLYVVHVLSSVGYRMVPYDAEVHAAELAARELKELWGKLAETTEPSSIELALIVRQGDVLAQVEDLIKTEGIDLVVLGTHGRSGVPKVMLGSTAESIFRNVTCPVLTVGPFSSQDWPEKGVGAGKAILYATDLQDTSLKALPYALSIANRSGSKLVIFHAKKSSANSDPASIAGNPAYTPEEVSSRVLRQRLLSLVPNVVNAEPDIKVSDGAPGDAILVEATKSNAGVIVLGLHQHSIIVRSGHSLSTTAYQVVNGAACPVLTVRS